MTPTTRKKVVLQFTMQDQLGDAMCWAAVGVSCVNFYDPGSKWTQCQLAKESMVPHPHDCCANAEHSPCNTPWYLQNEKGIGSFVTAQIADNFQEGFISFEQLMAELDQGRPVAYLLEIDIDGVLDGRSKFTHFLIVAGYEQTTSEQNVVIYDSYFHKSEMAYQEFVTNYKCHGGVILGHNVTRGLVQYTFFSKPPNKV